MYRNYAYRKQEIEIVRKIKIEFGDVVEKQIRERVGITDRSRGDGDGAVQQSGTENGGKRR